MNILLNLGVVSKVEVNPWCPKNIRVVCFHPSYKDIAIGLSGFNKSFRLTKIQTFAMSSQLHIESDLNFGSDRDFIDYVKRHVHVELIQEDED
jgi:hypothetical protein